MGVPGVPLLQRLQQPHDPRSMSRPQALLDAIRTDGYRNPYAFYTCGYVESIILLKLNKIKT